MKNWGTKIVGTVWNLPKPWKKVEKKIRIKTKFKEFQFKILLLSLTQPLPPASFLWILWVDPRILIESTPSTGLWTRLLQLALKSKNMTKNYSQCANRQLMFMTRACRINHLLFMVWLMSSGIRHNLQLSCESIEHYVAHDKSYLMTKLIIWIQCCIKLTFEFPCEAIKWI